MRNRLDLKPRKSEPPPTPKELAFNVGIAMLIALSVALLVQWIAPSH
jgi:hypothetical protein